MDIYHIWANKTGDMDDREWVTNLRSFLDTLVADGDMLSYRITRCKLGFRSIADLPEWHIMMEFKDMAHLDKAFSSVSKLTGDLEDKHRSFNQFVADDIQHALYRDWPDDVR